MCRRGEHRGGRESCVAEGKGFALPVCKPPPGCRSGGGQVVPVVAPAVILAGFCRKKTRRRGAFLYILSQYVNKCSSFCKFSFISSTFAPGFGEILRLWLFRLGPAAVCWMVTAWSQGARRRCRSPSVRCSARNIGRRATLLPSPLRRSFLPVSAPRWWSPFFSVVLLLWAPCWGLWRSFLSCWVWLYTGVHSYLFNRARNKRARTRKGWRRSSSLLCPLRGC